jgi:hypothetical protein
MRDHRCSEVTEMYRDRLLALCAALACSMSALTAAAADWGSQIGNRLGDGRELVMRSSATGTVTAVDAGARLMALKLPAGSMIFRLDAAVPNVDQIRVGGHVRVGYLAGYLLKARKRMDVEQLLPSAPPVVERAALDDEAYDRSLTFLADVVSMDRDNLKLRMKGPGGQLEDFPVFDRSSFAGVRVGSQIWISMLQAVAMDVTPLP